MAFSGGTFSRTFDCTTDRDNGVKILASKFDTELDGMATGLSTCILKDGTQTCTAAIPFAEGLTVPDNKTIVLGTNSDITIQYDESTNDSLEIAANVEGAALGIVLKADQGDDNADQHKVGIADGGTLTMASKISGSFVSYLTHTPNSTVASSTTAVAGNLTVGGDLTLGSGAVISEAELEAIDGVTAGTVTASKAVIVDSNKDIASFRNVTLTGELDAGSLDISGDADIDGTLETDALSINGTAVTATGAELNYSDTGAAVGTVVASKVVTADANKDVASFRNITLTGELDAGSLDVSGDADIDGTLEADAMTLNGTAITATATLDTGISNNNVAKFTSGVADNDFLRVDGTAIEGRSASEVLSDIAAAPAAGSSNIVTTGALNSGSITSGFGSIDTGSSNITTTGVGSFGSLDISGDIDVDGTTNLDVVDIDGAVDMASTLQVDGNTTFSGDVTFTGDNYNVVWDKSDNSLEFKDNARARFGDSNDLQIYHTGVQSQILDIGSGDLWIGGDANINIANAALNEYKAVFASDGAVTLYHDNSAKIATASTGIDITGGVTATDTCTFSSANNVAQLILKSTDADADSGPQLDLTRDSSSPANSDSLGKVRFMFDNDAGQSIVAAQFETSIMDVQDSIEAGRFTLRTMTAGTATSRLDFTNTETVFNDSSIDVDFRVEGATNANLLTVDAGDEAVRINATATAPGSGNTNAGMEFREAGLAFFSSASGYVNINKNGDGGLIYLNNSGNANGIIGSFDSGQNIFIGSGDTGVAFNPNVDGVLPHNPTTNAQRDNAIDLGYSSVRYDDIFATNGTIQTSDENEKQNIASLTSAEITAAKAISKLFKTFKWKDKVTAKGDAARTHTGVIAQEVQAAMSAAGLDATKYAFWCSDTWWEKSTEMAAVEADEDKGIKAIPSHTRTDTYHTESEAPEGATKRTRLGVRYPELLAFIGAATEQRLVDIETRLAALEAG